MERFLYGVCIPFPAEYLAGRGLLSRFLKSDLIEMALSIHGSSSPPKKPLTPTGWRSCSETNCDSPVPCRLDSDLQIATAQTEK